MLDTATDTAFLRTILADPDDDAPRLIYADWLDEQGDADRAEFIRLQIQFARMVPNDADYPEVESRIVDLCRAHHVEWTEQLPQIEHVDWKVFRRGFISTVKVDHPDALFAHARDIFAAAPIQELRLHQFCPKDARRLAELPYLRRIETLDLGDGNRIGIMGVEKLMASPHLRSLRELRLAGNALGSAAMRAVAHSSYARDLAVLRVNRNDLYDGLAYLATSSAMAKLEKLDLHRTRTSEDAIVELSKSKHMTRLKWLDLSHNLVSTHAMLALAGSSVLTEVRDLFLDGNSIGTDGAIAMAQSPQFARLERLFLRQNNIRDDGAIALAESPHLGNVREVYLGENRISDWAADRLRARFGSGVNIY
jgi:uncharacterized protein (TIGR02996 family)